MVCIEDGSYISGTPKVNYEILCQYIYLDEEERDRMSKSKLEYLIEKYDYTGLELISQNKSISIKLLN